MRKALFPGSFDPITLGHLEIVERAVPLFDEILISIGVNSSKKSFFELETRISMLEACFKDQPTVHVQTYDGLTVDFAKEKEARFLLRGLRSGQDLEYERPIALINRHMMPELETIFLISSGNHSHISSTLVREVIRYGGDVSGLVPEAIIPLVQKHRPG